LFRDKGIIEIWTTKNIKKGEGFFNNYEYNFAKCNWCDKVKIRNGNVPKSIIGNKLVLKITKNHNTSV